MLISNVLHFNTNLITRIKNETKQHKIECLDIVRLGTRKQQDLAFTKKEKGVEKVIFSLFYLPAYKDMVLINNSGRCWIIELS